MGTGMCLALEPQPLFQSPGSPGRGGEASPPSPSPGPARTSQIHTWRYVRGGQVKAASATEPKVDLVSPFRPSFFCALVLRNENKGE